MTLNDEAVETLEAGYDQLGRTSHGEVSGRTSSWPSRGKTESDFGERGKTSLKFFWEGVLGRRGAKLISANKDRGFAGSVPRKGGGKKFCELKSQMDM